MPQEINSFYTHLQLIKPKRKRKKRKRFQRGWILWMQAFRLKNFPFKESKRKNGRNTLGKILSETRRA
jgi:hypothetical protein